MTDLSGRTIKGYAVQRKVAEGGFGAVYYALQPLVTPTGREVAVKVILPQFANIPSFIRRFEAEAQTIARLEHPHIVPLYDYWRDPWGAYLVMRWMPRGSLTAVQGQGKLALEMVVRVVNQLASALAFAHRQGVVHRDLKPANILFDSDSNAYLADFGIAKGQDPAGATPLSESPAFTPGYAAPEQIQHEPATPASDIYSLGVVFYELLTGVPAFQAPTPAQVVQQQLAGKMLSIHDYRPDMPSALDGIIQHATARDPLARYTDAWQLVAEVQRALGSAETGRVADRRTVVLDLADRRNPYKGLRAFQEADAADFFGREALIQRLLSRLGEPNEAARFLAVIGPSGSGKSSVVRAGVVPALRRGALPGADRWFIVDCVPGAHPWEEIEAALLRVAMNPPTSLLAQLQEDERGLLRAVKRVLPADEAVELILVIDQFEELWTMVADEPARAQLLTSLLMSTCDPRSRLRVIVTLRADFYDRPLQYPAFGEQLRQRTEVVLPLTPEELEQAIVAPAQRVGVAVAPELVQAIISDVGTQPGALPLMQYVLTELFEHRAEPVLTLAAYKASGGVLGVLAHRADAVYDRLDAAGQEAVRQVLVRLVALGEEVAATRRRVPRAELTEIVPDVVRLDVVLDTLGRARLLTFDHDPVTRRSTVEIAHEALLRAWPRLDQWLSDDRASLRLRESLRQAAREWASAASPDDSLLVHSRGARLVEAIRLAERPGYLSAQEQAYVRACIALHDREVREKEEQHQRELAALEAHRKAEELARSEAEQRVAEGNRSRRSLRRRLLIAVVLAVVALVTAGVATYRSVQERSILLALLSQEELAGERRDLAITLAMEANRMPIPLVPAPKEARRALVNAAYYTPGTRLRLVGHDGAVTSVAFSPDGHFALSGSADKKVILWDLRDGERGKELWHQQDLEGAVTSVAFSPDGHTALACVDKKVILWDRDTGKELRRLEGHNDVVTSIAVSPDGRMAVSGSRDKTLILWDLMKGTKQSQLRGNANEAIISVAFNPKAPIIAFGTEYIRTSKEGIIRLWDTKTGEVHELQDNGQAYSNYSVDSLAFNPDGTQLFAGLGGFQVVLWDQEVNADGSIAPEAHIHPGWPASHPNAALAVAFSPDGRLGVSGSQNSNIYLWDMANGKVLHTFVGHDGQVNAVAFSPDGKWVLSASADHSLRLWDTLPGAEPGLFTDELFGNAAISLSGKTVLSGYQDSKLRLWQLDGTIIRTINGHPGDVLSVAIRYDDERALTGSTDSNVYQWDLTHGRLLQPPLKGHPGWVNCVTFSPDGRFALSGSYPPIGSPPKDMLILWDLATGTALRHLDGHTNVVRSVAFSPDGQTALSADADGKIILWDLKSGKEIRQFPGHLVDVLSVAFSPDGRTALSGSADKTLVLWDIATGKLLRRYEGHLDGVSSVAFHPLYDNIALSGSTDGTLRLWDLKAGAQLARWVGHPAGVRHIDFALNGAMALSAGQEHTMRLWQVDPPADILTWVRENRYVRELTADERRLYGLAP